jgi:hypothetical protein
VGSCEQGKEQFYYINDGDYQRRDRALWSLLLIQCKFKQIFTTTIFWYVKLYVAVDKSIVSEIPAASTQNNVVIVLMETKIMSRS